MKGHMCTCSSLSQLTVTCFLLNSLCAPPGVLTPRCISSSGSHMHLQIIVVCVCECVSVRECVCVCVFAVVAHWMDHRGVAQACWTTRTPRTGFLTVNQSCKATVGGLPTHTHIHTHTQVRRNCIIESHRRLSWNISNLMLLISVYGVCVCVCPHVPFVSHFDPCSRTSLVWPLFPKFPCFLW